MPAGIEKIQEEMREAQVEIEGDDAEHDTGAVSANGDVIRLEEVEEGLRRRVDAPPLRSLKVGFLRVQMAQGIAVVSWGLYLSRQSF